MKRILLFLSLLVFLPLVVSNGWARGQAHDVTTWHAPTLYHHHGANPDTAHPLLQEAMDLYWSQEIGNAWQSSVHENEFPAGDHAGFKNIIENDVNCPRGKIIGNTDPCINAFIVQLHATGTVAHARKNIHSAKAILLVCEGPEIVESECGYVVVGSQNSYQFTASPYNRYFCAEPGGVDPVVEEQYQFLPPYVALPNRITFAGSPRERNNIFWTAQGPHPVTADRFLDDLGYVPNRGLQLVWNEVDAWDQAVGFSPLCFDPASDTRICPDNVSDAQCRWNGTEFQMFVIIVEDLPTQRPFAGWTNRHGVVRTDGLCVEEGVDCIPLIISENVPVGRPFMNRVVGPDPEDAPILNYDDGTLLRRPPFTLP